MPVGWRTVKSIGFAPEEIQLLNRLTDEGREMNNWSSNEKGATSARVTPAPPAPAAVAPGGTGVHIASLTGCIEDLNC
jgi:hypothetical protein